MNRITLHTASVDNSGRRVEAGASLVVGKKPEEIAEPRALDLVRRACAVDATPAKKPVKTHD